MLFQTIDFVIFLLIVFSLYWFLQKKPLNYQNFFLVLASYVFYGWWDWRFLVLIFLSSLVDFLIALELKKQKQAREKKILLSISLIFNLGLLAIFKYFNFFIENFVNAFSLLGADLNLGLIEIILPVGISFYTFQTLSYTIDVFRSKIEPTKNILGFFAYVSFFPQLVAGPIERATELLPQFLKRRQFDYKLSVDGMRQILWGLFKKIVIADQCAIYVNEIFENQSNYSGSALILGAVFFSFQIYGDFSGYSDMAIGIAKLFGFTLSKNFSYPYFSRDIAEFWRRWHISLSSWFRDYLYIPLGGSKKSIVKNARNIFIVFLVSGLWHGANWTFVFWGLLNAFYFIPLFFLKKNRQNIDVIAENKSLPTIRQAMQVLFTFVLVTSGWVIFRCSSVNYALIFFSRVLKGPIFKTPYVLEKASGDFVFPFTLIIIIVVFKFIEWLGRRDEHPLKNIMINQPRGRRYLFYFILLFLIYWHSGTEEQFIYFQF